MTSKWGPSWGGNLCLQCAIQANAKPFEDAINSIILDEYGNFVIKGNLLLLADRPKEAREVFEQAYDLAPGDQMESAVENVARAIRAQAGTVGPANAYILSLRAKTNLKK